MLGNFVSLIANIQLEATVVAIVCSVFLALFVAAGVRQVMSEDE